MWGVTADATTTRNAIDERRLASLFRAMNDGDDAAFRALHDVLSKPLMAYCLSFTRDMDDAKDLFQHTMLRVFEHRHRYREQNLMAWIFTIARNACRTWEQRQRRHVTLDDSALVDDAAPPSDDVVQIVQQAILQLPDEFRVVILLRYFGDMSVKDIAASEDISESLVKVRLFRARERLSIILGPLIEPDA